MAIARHDPTDDVMGWNFGALLLFFFPGKRCPAAMVGLKQRAMKAVRQKHCRWVIACVLLPLFLVGMLLHAADRGSADLLLTQAELPAVIPLFVAVVNDYRYLELLAQRIAEHNLHVMHRPTCSDDFPPFLLQLHVLDNTGCERHARDSNESSLFFESHEHLRTSRRLAREVSSNCAAWQSLVLSLTAACRSVDDRCRTVLTPVVSTPSRGVALLFGQSMNWFIASAQAEPYRQPWFMFAHSDTQVLDAAVLHETLRTGYELSQQGESYSYIFTMYDSLCLVHAAAIALRAGEFDSSLWYYGEVDLMLRAELAGLPAVQIAPSAFSGMVHHDTKSSIRQLGLSLQAKERSESGSNSLSRFQHLTRVKMRLWREYYVRKWDLQFQIPDIVSYKLPLLVVELLRGTVPSPRFPTLRALVDAFGRRLGAPHPLVVRTVDIFPSNSSPCNETTVARRASASVSRCVLYFIPREHMYMWVDTVTSAWEANQHQGERNSTAAVPTLPQLLKELGLKSLEIAEHLLDQR